MTSSYAYIRAVTKINKNTTQWCMGISELCCHWFSQWLVTCVRQAITSGNADLLSTGQCSIMELYNYVANIVEISCSLNCSQYWNIQHIWNKSIFTLLFQYYLKQLYMLLQILLSHVLLCRDFFNEVCTKLFLSLKFLKNISCILQRSFCIYCVQIAASWINLPQQSCKTQLMCLDADKIAFHEIISLCTGH